MKKIERPEEGLVKYSREVPQSFGNVFIVVGRKV